MAPVCSSVPPVASVSRTRIRAILCVGAIAILLLGLGLPPASAQEGEGPSEASSAPAAENRPGTSIASPAGSISGIFSRMAALAEHTPRSEAGIGALMPWADRLWLITYVSHKAPTGAGTGLYSVGETMELRKHPESVVGTYANRMIHGPTDQLMIGPHLVDTTGLVPTIDGLAEYGGTEWRILSRDAHVGVAAYEGIGGAIYASGWDRASAKLQVFHEGTWSTYRLPKGSHSWDHAWTTEWMRIREVETERLMLDLHGQA